MARDLQTAPACDSEQPCTLCSALSHSQAGSSPYCVPEPRDGLTLMT